MIYKYLLNKTRLIRASHGSLMSNFEVRLKNRFCSYIQGQSPEPRVREYFYYIDHQGMVNIPKELFNFVNNFFYKKNEWILLLEFFYSGIRFSKHFQNLTLQFRIT